MYFLNAKYFLFFFLKVCTYTFFGNWTHTFTNTHLFKYIKYGSLHKGRKFVPKLIITLVTKRKYNSL